MWPVINAEWIQFHPFQRKKYKSNTNYKSKPAINTEILQKKTKSTTK